MNTSILIRILSFSVLLLGFAVGHALAQQNTGTGQEMAQLRKRVSDLESQIQSMNVIIGALESLVKQQKTSQLGQFSTQSSADSGVPIGGDEGSERINILETKIQALTAQIEQLTLQVQNGASSGVQKQSNTGFGDGNTSQGEQYQQRQNDNNGNSRLAALPTVKSQDNGQGSNPAMMYDEAYGYLLRRDYPAAEKAFRQFLKIYKNDTLAGNAQYWLGETYYQQGNYRKAADSFLNGYSKFRRGPKAPDSLLKLALSLHKLGQKDAACTTFFELRKTFPQAPGHILDRVEKETRRLRCS